MAKRRPRRPRSAPGRDARATGGSRSRFTWQRLLLASRRQVESCVSRLPITKRRRDNRPTSATARHRDQRHVMAEADLAGGPGEAAIVDLAHRQLLGLALLRHLVDGGPAFLVGQRSRLGRPAWTACVHQVEQRTGFGSSMSVLSLNSLPPPSYGGGAPEGGGGGRPHRIRRTLQIMISYRPAPPLGLSPSGPAGHLPRKTGEESRGETPRAAAATSSARSQLMQNRPRPARSRPWPAGTSPATAPDAGRR